MKRVRYKGIAFAKKIQERFFLRSRFVNWGEMNRSLADGSVCEVARFRNGTVLFHPPGRTGFVRMILEVYHEQVYTGAFYHPKPEDVIVDAGANIGTFSIHTQMLEPMCHVYAFEPFPENFGFLKRNVASNSIDNVHVLQMAVSGSCQNVQVVAHGTRSQDHRVTCSRGDAGDFVSVSSVNLSRIFEVIDAKEIALFKCDIEGSEKDLFASATPSEINRVNRFAIEFHDNIVEGARETIENALASTHVLRFGSVSPHGYGMIYATRKQGSR